MAARHVQRLLQITLAAMALAACVGCADGRGESRAMHLERVDNVTYLGCVGLDEETHRLLLWMLDEAQPGQPGPALARTDQSTSVNGPWVGTRQLELVGNQAEALRAQAGHRVRVTGVLEEQHGRTGNIDQVQHRQGAVFRRLQAAAFQAVAGPCAVYSGAGPSSPGDPVHQR